MKKIATTISQQSENPAISKQFMSGLEGEEKKWDKHIKSMDAERLVKISRDNIPAERWSPGHPKESGVT